MKIKEDVYNGGIKIITEKDVFYIYADLEYEIYHGHGGGSYIKDVKLKVIHKEIK
jgi:hypothetical protein